MELYLAIFLYFPNFRIPTLMLVFWSVHGRGSCGSRDSFLHGLILPGHWLVTKIVEGATSFYHLRVVSQFAIKKKHPLVDVYV